MKDGNDTYELKAYKADILDNLRRIPRESWAEIEEPSGWSYHTNIGNLIHGAIDEIENLRRQLKELREKELLQKNHKRRLKTVSYFWNHFIKK